MLFVPVCYWPGPQTLKHHDKKRFALLYVYVAPLIKPRDALRSHSGSDLRATASMLVWILHMLSSSEAIMVCSGALSKAGDWFFPVYEVRMFSFSPDKNKTLPVLNLIWRCVSDVFVFIHPHLDQDSFKHTGAFKGSYCGSWWDVNLNETPFTSTALGLSSRYNYIF